MVLSQFNIEEFSEWYNGLNSTGGTVLIDKPMTWTSFGVCGKLRGMLKIKKVGHAGTLDPLATGLLIICLGKNTKNISGFQDQSKEYIADIKLGATTKSFDAEFEEENKKPYSHLTDNELTEIVNSFIGEIEQVPPIFSALKVNGRRLYKLARKDENIEIQPRKVYIEDIKINKIELPILNITVKCSKGTYIRSLAKDIGEKAGSGAYLLSLRRTKIGSFSVDDAVSIEDLNKLTEQHRENEGL